MPTNDNLNNPLIQKLINNGYGDLAAELLKAPKTKNGRGKVQSSYQFDYTGVIPADSLGTWGHVQPQSGTTWGTIESRWHPPTDDESYHPPIRPKAKPKPKFTVEIIEEDKWLS